MNENKGKITSLIRAIICVVVMGVIVLDWVNIIPTKISIIVSTVLLCGVTIWNGIEAVQSGKKAAAILNFVMSAIMAALCVISFVL